MKYFFYVFILFFSTSTFGQKDTSKKKLTVPISKNGTNQKVVPRESKNLENNKSEIKTEIIENPSDEEIENFLKRAKQNPAKQNKAKKIIQNQKYDSLNTSKNRFTFRSPHEFIYKLTEKVFNLNPEIRPKLVWNQGVVAGVWSFLKLLFWILIYILFPIAILEIVIKYLIIFFKRVIDIINKTSLIYSESFDEIKNKSIQNSSSVSKLNIWVRGFYLFIVKIFKKIFVIE